MEVPLNRQILREQHTVPADCMSSLNNVFRLLAIMVSEKMLAPQVIERVFWATHEVLPGLNPAFTKAGEMALLSSKMNAPANRIRPAMRVTWMERIAARMPIVLSALHGNHATLLHLPAESFVEYQLRAQRLAPSRFVATAAYGDGGAGYIPIQEAFPLGGYEVSVANCDPGMDGLLTHGMTELLGSS